MSGDAARAAETAARSSFGRLVAAVASRTGDIAAAQDAVSAAFVRALETWPVRGVPESPEAWLVATARHAAIDRARAERRAARAVETIEMLIEERASGEPPEWPEERLKLIFACAHPAIAEPVRAPLILQTVLGIDAARIAAAFLVAPNTMGVSLARAKEKIARARIPFAIPEGAELASRSAAVLDAIYAAYSLGWDAAFGQDAKARPLAQEALWLASLVARLLENDPEALGLFALILACESRRGARRAGGRFVPVAEQDPALWDRRMMVDARSALRAAAALGRPGRYQIEAAIQLAHLARADGGKAEPQALVRLYDRLVAHSPTVGAYLARAAALAEAGDPAAALAETEALAGEAGGHQPWWALRADLLSRLGRGGEARESYLRAAELCSDEAVRQFLLDRAGKADSGFSLPT